MLSEAASGFASEASAKKTSRDLDGKRRRAQTEGVNAWVDPEGYRRWVAHKKRAFEDQVDVELGAPKAATK